MDIIKIAQAANNSIVTCSGSDCSVCSILESVSNIYNFVLGLSFAAAVLFLTFAGIVYIFGIGRNASFQKAKIFARNTILGFIFILVGWIAIHAVLFSTGYQNAGGWWQFRCAVETANVVSENGVINGSVKLINSYSNIADFIASGNVMGVVKEPVSEAVFLNQLNTLKEGETLTFYLPAKKNTDGQEEIQVPFLAGFKTSSGISINPESQIRILTDLINGISDGSISLLGSGGSALSSADSSKFIRSLITVLISSLNPGASGNLNLFDSISSLSGSSLTSTIENLSSALKNSIAENPPDASTVIGKAIASVANTALNNADNLVAQRSSESSSSKTASGDRSEDDSSSKAKKWAEDLAKPRTDPKDWSKKGDPLPPGTHSDDFSDIISDHKDKERDKDSDSSLCPDDWKEETNERMAILKTLRRIAKFDRLRYEMIFRFVSNIGKKEGGGECTGCGDIKVLRKAKILDIAHILIHEGTHSGQFCLNLMEKYMAEGMGTPENPGPGRGKIEAIACANQLGAIEANKSHQDMKEFEGKQKDGPVENRTEIKNSKMKNGQVRGHLARYWDMNTPKGDLDEGMLGNLFKKYTEYPISQNYQNGGPYHYGFCFTENHPYLKLRNPEEEVVKEIVTSKKLPDGQKCLSSPPKDILPACNPEKGDKPEPLPRIPDCEGAPEINIQ
ncbi:MAG: pilin [Candidatus Moraniibacteriota bacterium]